MSKLFATTLRDIRLRRKLTQKAFADALGYEASYISALENGLKPPPRDVKLNTFINKLNISPAEGALLRAAAERTLRKKITINVPKSADQDLLEMYELLQAKLPEISGVQIQMIKLALSTSRQEEPKM